MALLLWKKNIKKQKCKKVYCLKKKNHTYLYSYLNHLALLSLRDVCWKIFSNWHISRCVRFLVPCCIQWFLPPAHFTTVSYSDVGGQQMKPQRVEGVQESDTPESVRHAYLFRSAKINDAWDLNRLVLTIFFTSRPILYLFRIATCSGFNQFNQFPDWLKSALFMVKVLVSVREKIRLK